MEKFKIVIRQDDRVVFSGWFPAPEAVECTEHPLKVGDYVEVVRDYGALRRGWVGKIVAEAPSSTEPWGVEFVQHEYGLHTLGGRVSYGHGFWTPTEYLKLRA